MASGRRGNRYCRCGTVLARDNAGRQCARCKRDSRDRLVAPPEVPPEFWLTPQFHEAFAAQHMGRVSRAYRVHPYHYAFYGPDGISQDLLGQWIGLRQPQISRLETGPPIRHLDTLRHWARILRIPPHLLWFQLPEDTHRQALATPALDPNPASADGTDRDPILTAPWNQRGTVKAVVVLSGGDQVRRRVFLSLTGPALTAPAHQWLVHEPEPLISGLSGRRISPHLVDRLPAMIAELRKMDDVAGGGSVLALAQQHFGWVTGLLDRSSYDGSTAGKLHRALAELGQFCGWAAYDAGDFGLAQRYYIAGLRAAHTVDDRIFGAHILATMANQAARQGQPTEAVTLVETALAGSRGKATPALLAELHFRHAYAFAVRRDASGCTAALSQARTQVENLKPDDDPPWLYWLDAAAIAVGAGNCLLGLGRADEAATMLRDGIDQFGGSFVRDRLIYTTRLADALTRPGKKRDLDAAVELGMQSLALAENLESNTGADHLGNLRHRLKQYDQVPAVRDFLECVSNLVPT